jgi:uncharacterized protein (DUF2252 family)
LALKPESGAHAVRSERVQSMSEADPSGKENHPHPGFSIESRAIPIDLRQSREPWETRRAAGKRLRDQTPREEHAQWTAPANRPDPVEVVLQSNRGRQPHLIPLRMARMAASPFAFLRGAAAVMAWDLALTPVSGIEVVVDGDAHLSNFGLYGTPQGDVVFDLNDFDETTYGPWEFDLKRLVASVNVAAREHGANRKERRRAVMRCVAGYRGIVERLQGMGLLDVWHLHAYAGYHNPMVRADAKSREVFVKAHDKALQQNNASLLRQAALRQVDGSWGFKEEPPTLTRVDPKTAELIIDALNSYAGTIAPERRALLRCYHVVDVAHRVVGVGSVGTRAYLALLFGNGDDDPLFLQVKEAVAPALKPYVAPLPPVLNHEGRRVVMGQRTLQASSDMMIGWTTIGDRHYYVRQMKNFKGSIPLEELSGKSFDFYAWACGSLLGRAHSRWGDAAALAGYCGNSEVLDNALADFAEAYGDQTARDHAAMVEAVKQGRVAAADATS